MAPIFTSVFASSILLFLPGSYSFELPKSDVDLLEFPLNLVYLEAEFFLFGSLGYGLDKVAPNLTLGGPAPWEPKRPILILSPMMLSCNLLGKEVGHLRAIKKTVKEFPRPLLDLNAGSFAKVIDKAFGKSLNPPFDPYANSINYLTASYLIPYVGLTGYVGANPNLQDAISKRLVAGLLGVESGLDAVVRALLYEKANEKVHPYGIRVSEFTNKISQLRNTLGNSVITNEGLAVPKALGAEGKKGKAMYLQEMNTQLHMTVTPEDCSWIGAVSGNQSVPGGFYPKGGDGQIARSHPHTA